MNTLIMHFSEWSGGVCGVLGNSRIIIAALEREGSKVAVSALIKFFPSSSVLLIVNLTI